jgi:NAD(P)-dependent dehydrogenase (short-subunit alcohol dehydrogenase family)
MSFEGKTALVTGATRGIGRAIVACLKNQGARVIGAGTAAASSIGDLDDYVQADFSIHEDIVACAARVSKLAPDILVNNAGINKIAPFTEISLEDFTRIQRVNVTAPFALCQAAVGPMRERGWGRIVNVSSIWGKISKEQRASYSAAKFAIDGFTLALALEYARYGVLANCVAPGFTDTELTRKVLGELQIAQLIQSVPAGRLANVDEIARLVAWLAGTENTFVTGQNIAIDGGFTRA